MIYRDSKGRFCKAPIKGYKGFEQGLICRGKQYKVGEVFTESEAVPCESGIHFCKNPLDVLTFYPPVSSIGIGIPNEYAEVEALEEPVTDDGTKFCTTKLKVVRKLNLDELIQAGIDYALEHNQNVKKAAGICSIASNTGDYSTASTTGGYSTASTTGDYNNASTTGDYNNASTTGDYSTASTTGYRGIASNTGERSTASSTGYLSIASNTGSCSIASTTGDCSIASTTGDCSIASTTGVQSIASTIGYRSSTSNTGYRGIASNTGERSTASVSGKRSIAVNTGYKGKVKGALGCWITSAEWERGEIVDIQTRYVDGKKIKADTWYRLENGKFVEVN